MEELLDIQSRVNARAEADLLHTHVEIIQFCSPPPKSGLSETSL
jgi:hypothetical protein